MQLRFQRRLAISLFRVGHDQISHLEVRFHRSVVSFQPRGSGGIQVHRQQLFIFEHRFKERSQTILIEIGQSQIQLPGFLIQVVVASDLKCAALTSRGVQFPLGFANLDLFALHLHVEVHCRAEAIEMIIAILARKIRQRQLAGHSLRFLSLHHVRIKPQFARRGSGICPAERLQRRRKIPLNRHAHIRALRLFVVLSCARKRNHRLILLGDVDAISLQIELLQIGCIALRVELDREICQRIAAEVHRKSLHVGSALEAQLFATLLRGHFEIESNDSRRRGLAHKGLPVCKIQSVQTEIECGVAGRRGVFAPRDFHRTAQLSPQKLLLILRSGQRECLDIRRFGCPVDRQIVTVLQVKGRSRLAFFGYGKFSDVKLAYRCDDRAALGEFDLICAIDGRRAEIEPLRRAD